MIGTVLQVALGGAIGASMRYVTGVGIVRLFGLNPFPLGIITVNVLGSFIMGIVTVVLGRTGWTHLNPLIAVGALGGFTTFSSFSLETMVLMERGQVGLAAIYVILSVSLSIGALALGFAVARGAFA